MKHEDAVRVAIDMVEQRGAMAALVESGDHPPKFWAEVGESLKEILDSIEFNNGPKDEGRHIELRFNDETSVKEKFG